MGLRGLFLLALGSFLLWGAGRGGVEDDVPSPKYRGGEDEEDEVEKDEDLRWRECGFPECVFGGGDIWSANQIDRRWSEGMRSEGEELSKAEDRDDEEEEENAAAEDRS